MQTIISNTSPLIILAKAGLLDILRKQFSKVLVPRAVVDEIKAGPASDSMRNHIDTLPWIELIELASPLTPLAYWRLGRGESEVIEYARLNPGTIALLDDRAARNAAVTLNIPIYGTLSVAARSSLEHSSLSFEIIVERLRDAGLYLDERVVQIVNNELSPKKKS